MIAIVVPRRFYVCFLQFTTYELCDSGINSRYFVRMKFLQLERVEESFCSTLLFRLNYLDLVDVILSGDLMRLQVDQPMYKTCVHPSTSCPFPFSVVDSTIELFFQICVGHV